ncbi:MAG: c-type cytochrome [Vicinamibacterales bacterium]
MTRRLLAWARRRPKAALAGGVVLLALTVFGVVASGVAPITASSGHWAVTEWILQFAMRRSVTTHALLGPAPPVTLDRDALVMQGAGHYEIGCRSCHGAPGQPVMPPVPGAMTPHPPALPPAVGTWDARELFYIVKHGVKFTGMPAWPALHRDDEIWAMVAFLRRMPSLDAEGYARVAGHAVANVSDVVAETPVGQSVAPDVVVQQCARCHGLDGLSRGLAALPRLAGQREEYLSNALSAYATGRRFSGTMIPVAAALSPEARAAAARYFASLPAPPADDGRLSEATAPGEGAPAGAPPLSREAASREAPQPDTATPTDAPTPSGDAVRGADIARRGLPSQDVPSCNQCHGPEAVNDAYPQLAGQPREYLARQLTLLQGRQRGGSEYVQIMHEVANGLTAQDIADVTAHYASQVSGTSPAGTPP